MRKEMMKIREITSIALCLAMLCVSSYVSIPLPFMTTPITAQTIMINTIALWLTPAQAMTTMGAYLILGLIGFPVFAGGSSGISVFLRPTGGFLIAFFISVGVISGLKKRFPQKLGSNIFLTVGIGMPIVYFVGAFWMSILMDIDFVVAFQLSVYPFIVGDLLKCLIACRLVERLNGTMKQRSVFIKRKLV